MNSADPGDIELDIDITVTETSASEVQPLWDAIWDLDRYPAWNNECVEARWVDGASGPAVGARFIGRNVLGDQSWTVTCHIIECRAPTKVTWTVSEPSHPSSTWSYSLDERVGSTVVEQRFVHGPGNSGIRNRIRDNPASAPFVIEARSRMLEDNMRSGLRRLIALVEGQDRGSGDAADTAS